MSSLSGATYPVVEDSKVGDVYPLVRDGSVKKQTRTALQAFVTGETLKETRKGGPTANRPANPATFELYVDTDLSKIIAWDGVNWIADGVAV